MALHRIINGRGGTGHLATLVERMTRFTLVARVAPKESGCVMSAIIGMLDGIPKDVLKSCTFDINSGCPLNHRLSQIRQSA